MATISGATYSRIYWWKNLDPAEWADDGRAPTEGLLELAGLRARGEPPGTPAIDYQPVPLVNGFAEVFIRLRLRRVGLGREVREDANGREPRRTHELDGAHFARD